MICAKEAGKPRQKSLWLVPESWQKPKTFSQLLPPVVGLDGVAQFVHVSLTL